jgi:NADP oxidoreductase coenzyme F420-dependent
MRIAALGTGTVGRTIGTKLVELGHDVTMGSRTADNENARAWASGAGGGAAHGKTAEAVLGDFGWPQGSIIDLGDLTGARGQVRLMGTLGRLTSTSPSSTARTRAFEQPPARAGRPASSSPRPGSTRPSPVRRTPRRCA